MPTLTQQTAADFSSLDPGAYEMRLVSATMYRANNNASRFDSGKEDRIIPQISFRWETLSEVEDVDGEEGIQTIEQGYVSYTLNDRANLPKVFKALFPKTFGSSSKVEFRLEDGLEDVSALPMKEEREIKVESITVDGVSVFDNEEAYAVLNLELKDNGYNRVTGVTPPVKRGSSKRPT